MTCFLCADAASTGEIVFEDDDVFVLLHNDWSVLGHAMIVAKRHVENISDLENEEWLRFADVWRRAERALLALTHAERAVVMKLGIQTPHLHVHLFPVRASASREEVFAAIDGKTRVERDERFVKDLRALLTPPRY